MAESRLAAEFKKIEKELPFFAPVGGDLRHYRGWIPGPPNSPYKNRFFQLEIRLPIDYPFEPPIVRFLTPIWHPNIAPATGEICNDILKISGESKYTWSPGSDVVSVIMNVIAMLGGVFNIHSPLNEFAAKEFLKSRKDFDQKAQRWAEDYGKEAPVL
ncbi:MAG: ubiquitin-conjugating enzyme E2 [Candidatus Helarchaeota archaeon]|nr:ubiquitin-conjugating enzyme E2 [Candidatus Helarchaeota archaeon]